VASPGHAAQEDQNDRTSGRRGRDGGCACKAAPIEDQERASIADTIAVLSKTCRLLPFHESLFAAGFDLERRLSLTSVDALAVATILDDARTATSDRAFLSLDKRSMTPASSELKAVGVDVCNEAASLESWLKARGVTF